MKPYLDAHGVNASLILQPAPNGGWIVSELIDAADTRISTRVLGAFGCREEMVQAIAGQAEERKE